MDFDMIEAEIIACVGLCVNDFNNETKDVLLTNTTNAELLKMLSQFNVRVHCVGANPMDFAVNQNMNVADSIAKVTFYELAINLKVHKFDVIIDLQNKNMENYQKLLKNNGILIVDLELLTRDKIAKKNVNFNVLMPFKLQCDGYEKYYIFASNKFHPIADLSLQKLDLLENLQYCNAKVYEAVFAMPNYIKAELKGIVRN